MMKNTASLLSQKFVEKVKSSVTNKIIRKPSNALLPARYVNLHATVHSSESEMNALMLKSQVKKEPITTDPINAQESSLAHTTEKLASNEKTVSQINVLTEQCKSNIEDSYDTDENTISAYDSDENTESVSDTENAESDSTIPEGNSISKKQKKYRYYKIKDELTDTDEETNSNTRAESNNSASTSLPQIRIKNDSSNHSTLHDSADKNKESQISSRDTKLQNKLTKIEILKIKSLRTTNEQHSFADNSQTKKANQSATSKIKIMYDQSNNCNLAKQSNKNCAQSNNVRERSKDIIDMHQKENGKLISSVTLPIMSDGKEIVLQTDEQEITDHSAKPNTEAYAIKSDQNNQPTKRACEVNNEVINKKSGDDATSEITNNCNDTDSVDTSIIPADETALSKKIVTNNNETVSSNDSLLNESTNDPINKTLSQNSILEKDSTIKTGGKVAAENDTLKIGSAVEENSNSVSVNSNLQTKSNVKDNSKLKPNDNLIIESISEECNEKNDLQIRFAAESDQENGSQVELVARSNRKASETDNLVSGSVSAENDQTALKNNLQTENGHRIVAVNASLQCESTFQDVRMTSSPVIESSNLKSQDSSNELTADETHVVKNFSKSLFKYLDLNIKTDRDNVLESLNYMTSKCCQNLPFSLFYSGETKVCETYEEKSNLQIVEKKAIQNLTPIKDIQRYSKLYTPAATPCTMPSSTVNSTEKVSSVNENVASISLLSFEELKNILQRSTASVPLLYDSNSESIPSTKVCFVSPSLNENVSRNLPLSIESQKVIPKKGNNVCNAPKVNSSNCISGNDSSAVLPAKTDIMGSPFSNKQTEETESTLIQYNFKRSTENTRFSHPSVQENHITPTSRVQINNRSTHTCRQKNTDLGTLLATDEAKENTYCSYSSTQTNVEHISPPCTDKGSKVIIETASTPESLHLNSGNKSNSFEAAYSADFLMKDVENPSLLYSDEIEIIEETNIPNSSQKYSIGIPSRISCSEHHFVKKCSFISSGEMQNTVPKTKAESLQSRSNFRNDSSEESSFKFSSKRKKEIIPSNEELEKIILSASLLNIPSNTMDCVSNYRNTLLEKDMRNENKLPDTEEITQNSNRVDISSVSSSTNSVQAEPQVHPETVIQKVELLNRKKKSDFQPNIADKFSRTDTKVQLKDNAKKIINSSRVQQTVDNSSEQRHSCATVAKDDSNKSPVICKSAKMNKMGKFEQNISNYSKTDKSLAKANIKEIEMIPIIARSDKSRVSNLKGNERKASSISEHNKIDKADNCCQKISTSSVIEKTCILKKRTVPDKIEGKAKKIKLTPETNCQTKLIQSSQDPRFKSIFRQTSAPVDCILNSQLSNDLKSMLAYLPASSSVNAQALQQLGYHTSISTTDLHNRAVISQNALYPKMSSNEKHKDTPNCKEKQSTSQTSNQPSEYVDHALQKPGENGSPIFLRRKGNRALLSKCLYKKVGKHFIGINDLPSLILEWNASWLLTQKETKKCAPVCDGYQSVKDTYKNELEYYNTYFPLHLLSIWLKMSDTWKKYSIFFDSVYEDQVEKPNFVKITCSTVLSLTAFANWPKREDILLCKFTKPDGKVEEMFGRVCNVMAKDYKPPPNSSLQGKAGILKRVRFEFFCAEALEAPLLVTVQVQILCNIRIALLQNDALQHLNNVMKEVILDPMKYGSHLSFIPLQPHRDPTFHRCVKSIIDSVMSPRIRVTLVDTSSPCDVVFAISQLAVGLMKKHSPVLIALKNEDEFLKLANILKHCNLILAVKKKEVKIPDQFRKFMLEERLTVVPGREIFNKWHVTLTLLSSIFLGDCSDAFANQNLTCILHDAHLCTETETALLLYYDVKNLVLMGKHEVQTDMHPVLKRFGYNISLFSRFCKAK